MPCLGYVATVAGSSVHPPLNSGLLFEDVGDFIEKYPTSSSSPATNVEKECHNFLAGNHLRSRSRYKALDETGVMGVACRHEFPIVLINLRHGERIGYAVYLMKKLKERYSNHQINLLYDVACSLKGHLQSTGQDELLSFFSLAPIFHCYGHKASCQVKFSPRFAKGYSLTDGEVMERLWSQMRRFSRMTKEMRPSHHIDVLTDAFIYCATRAAANLAKLLPKRMKHAKEVLCRCEQQLNDLINKSPTSFHMEDVQQWILQEQKTLSCENENSCTNRWEEDYLNLLKAFTTLRECMEQSPNSETSAVLATKLTQMEIKLQQMEQTNGIVQRWQPSSPSYKCAEQRLNCKQQQLIKQKFEACARERWFLLSMKAKYAEGHALACRLARRLYHHS